MQSSRGRYDAKSKVDQEKDGSTVEAKGQEIAQLKAELSKKDDLQMTELRTLMKLYNEESTGQGAWKQKGSGSGACQRSRERASTSFFLLLGVDGAPLMV